MKKILLAAIIAFSVSGQAQGLLNKMKDKVGGKGGKLELFEEEKIDTDVYRNNVGKIRFSTDDFPRTLPEDQHLKTYTLGDKLSIRAFMANSPANSAMMQLAASGKKIKEINEDRSSFESRTKVAFLLYLDGKEISGTSHAQPFNKEEMTGLPTRSIAINDGTPAEFFGESLYQDILKNQDLLTPGVHKLKIELVPIVMGDATGFNYKPIAVGEIDMIVPKEIKVTDADCFPKKGITDAKLEAEVLKAMKGFFKDGAPNAFKVLITDKQITVIRDVYGNIVKKSFIACVVSKKGTEVWYDYFIFDKAFDGMDYMPATIGKDVTLNGYMAPSGKKVNSGCLKFLK